MLDKNISSCCANKRGSLTAAPNHTAPIHQSTAQPASDLAQEASKQPSSIHYEHLVRLEGG